MNIKKPVYYPDTSYIYGRFKKQARKFKNSKRKNWKPKLKIFKDSKKGLYEKNVQFILSELTEFEIKKTLMSEEGLSFENANKIYQNVLTNEPNYLQMICFKNIKINSCFLNNTLEKKLDLKDSLHMLIASKLKLVIITKETKKINLWKKNYTKVMSPEEFQNHLKNELNF
jgi:hypothetical protein